MREVQTSSKPLNNRAAAIAVGALLGLAVGLPGAAASEDEIQLRHKELLASTCFACHGVEGRRGEEVPALAGQSFRVLQAQLLAFRDDEVPDTTVMNRIAKGYTDEEIEALASYFSNLER
ncbi:sulfide dehydrogenase cytochrome subunit [Alkalispirillum mobile]|uniref:Sulfide dehydrogenase cytochrome subunit n=1 Tax=Alkalispirillum mobile TaxID=85925 RepID=A0A498C3X6_9GAMM|nr:c-type cytochrome [Alkalispirillum mobile]RLK50232.1 sulfide dehydrogenase cytochrome subunit [Alkalispirillum mobile]